MSRTSRKDREKGAFEQWIADEQPAGDSESVQFQWVNSIAYQEFLEDEGNK